jgi:hypothetical protein
MKCRITLALLMAVLLLRPVHGEATPEPDDGERFLDEVRRAYAVEDYTQLDTLFTRPAWDRTKALSEKQMNGLAHLVADHLQFGELPAAYRPGESWSEFIRANQRDRAMVRRNGINSLSVEKLRGMAVAGQISDPEVIPKLIDAFKHPSTNVRKYAYHTLESLTMRHFGGEVWGRGVEDAAKEPKYVQQWREWWLANRDKRPILSKELQNQVVERVVAMVDRIRKELGPKFPGEFDWIGEKPFIHDRFSLDYNPLVAYCYEPALRSALFPLPKTKLGEAKPREDLPYLLIEVNFTTTPDSDRKHDSSAYSRPTTKQLRTVYEEAVKGTDMRIQILLASPNEALGDALAKLLRKR